MTAPLFPTKGAVDVGIVARDPQVLVGWYTDVLGVEHVETFDSPVGSIHRLRFGASWLKILGGQGRPAVVDRTFVDQGTYLTFETRDVESVWSRAVESGASVVLPLETFGAGMVGTMRDPEGNLVELLQRG